ncbi:PhzF family phenazine biosynthesis protein [Micromonospora arborensis]|uniref:PhzF family phenazine biosynthesis protein n=1 Tax=Micromonospora arborensis TaxID=2116518 RepID=UPI003712CA73
MYVRAEIAPRVVGVSRPAVDSIAFVADLHVLRVFCGPGGRYGNQLGVVLDGQAVAAEQDRQAVAARLGYSETVFVDDAGTGVVDIYTPSVRLPFAGHPLVGTSWLLSRHRARPELLHAGGLGANLAGRRVHLDQGSRRVGSRQAHAAVRLSRGRRRAAVSAAR